MVFRLKGVSHRAGRPDGIRGWIPVLLLSLSFPGILRAQELTDSDQNFLLGALPDGTEKIFQSADQLISSSTDIQLAANQFSEKQSDSMDKELVGLGAALQMTSDSLRRMEPVLLKKE